MERLEGIKKANVVNCNQPNQVQENIDGKSPTEKEIKKIKKKLEQIEKLKQKQANGETLEICQVRLRKKVTCYFFCKTKFEFSSFSLENSN